jgi:hypothetical protein
MDSQRRRIWFIVGCAIVVCTCSLGQSADDFAPAQGPRGVSTVLKVTNEGRTLELKGELLAVPDSGLFVLTDNAVPGQPGAHTVVFAPWSWIQTGNFEQMAVKVKKGRPPSTSQKEILSRVSRFPQGISAELLVELLTAYGLKTVYGPHQPEGV